MKKKNVKTQLKTPPELVFLSAPPTGASAREAGLHPAPAQRRFARTLAPPPGLRESRAGVQGALRA